MTPAPFTYHAPRSLDEALAALASLGNARVLAGGQSLVPLLNLRLALLDHVVDFNRVPGLDGVQDDGATLNLGAMVRQRMLELSPVIAARCPLLAAAAAHVGSQQIRNRGTLGGSLCHLDPSAELPVAALALDAMMVARSLRGTRRIAFAEFPAGYLTSVLAPDEALVAIELPHWPAGHGWAFEEVGRRGHDYAIVSVAALVARASGRVARCAVAIGGLGPAPMRAAAAEAAMRAGATPSEAATLAAALPAEGDLHAPPGYRQHLARVLTARALTQAMARADG